MEMNKYLLAGLLLALPFFAQAADPRCESESVITHIDQELQGLAPLVQELMDMESTLIQRHAKKTGKSKEAIKQTFEQRVKNDEVLSSLEQQLFKLTEKLRVNIPIDLAVTHPANCDAFLEQVDADLKQTGNVVQQVVARSKQIMNEFFKPRK